MRYSLLSSAVPVSGIEPASGSEIMLLVLGGILTIAVGAFLIIFFIKQQMKEK